MIAKFIDACVRNRFLVIIIWLLITAWGIYAMYMLPIDAIPDLSDVQVIITTEFADQAPIVVEDQITYPLTTAMLAVPKAKVVRGFSQFGLSLVYVIFEDGTDIYWARSRVLEYLNYIRGKLPPGSTLPWAPTPPGSAGSINTCWKTPPVNMTWPNYAAFRIGISATNSAPSPASPKSPVSAASSSNIRWW